MRVSSYRDERSALDCKSGCIAAIPRHATLPASVACLALTSQFMRYFCSIIQNINIERGAQSLIHFYAPGLKGSLRASSNEIIRLSIRLSKVPYNIYKGQYFMFGWG